MKGDFFAEFLIEYWYIFLPIAIISIIWGNYNKKKIFNEEQILLEKMGFKRIVKPLYFRLPSNKLFFNTYSNKNPITSEKYPHLMIYLRSENAGESGYYYTRILQFKSKTNKKFPKFFLRRESIFDKLKSDIDYRNNPEFSKKFFLKPLGDKKNKLEVEKLFKNFSLQKKLLSNPLNIESNVDVMFYYWDGVKFPVEEIPQRISEVEFLHDNYFDVIV